jgi:cytochrome c553
MQDLRAAPQVSGDVQAGALKAELCTACHGPEGRSVVPMFPALAGQNATYTYQQLTQFKSGLRASPTMEPFVQPLSDADLRDVSAYFAAQSAQPADSTDGDAALDASSKLTGRSLYTRGDPARGIPACQGCHGADGAGMRSAASSRVPWHSFPTLAGQSADYTVQQLQAYQNRSRSGTTHAAIMQAVAGTLDEAAMQAVAAYIATSLPGR